MATAPDVPLRRLQREVVRLAHRGLDLEGFLSAVEARLSAVLQHDGAACFFTVDPATMLITGHHNRDLAADDARRRAVNAGVMENEYREADFNKFVDLARSPRRAESLEAATGGRPQRSRRFHSLLQPFGLEGELRAALVVDDSCWGGLALFRSPDRPGFGPGERRVAAALSAPLAAGIRSALTLHPQGGFPAGGGPSLIILDEEGRVQSVSPSAADHLSQLIDPEPIGGEGLPAVIHAVATRARTAAASGQMIGGLRVRVPTRSGGWLVIQGTTLEGRRPGTAVVIEPARRPDVALLLLEAHGLSEREVEVVLCVLRGLSTAQIGAALHISSYTVQDHLKAVFAKVGVRSRRELVARLFFDHYFPGVQEQQAVASREWPLPGDRWTEPVP